MSKWYAQSLGSSKVVYGRDEDPADTIIIRNLYPKAKDYQKVFGLKDYGTHSKVVLCNFKAVYYWYEYIEKTRKIC